MSGSTSNDQDSSPSNKRNCVGFTADTVTAEATGNANTQQETTSLLEAAMAMKNHHIEMLHKALQPFLEDLTETCLRRFAAYYYKNAKHEEMFLDANYVPTSCKKFGLTLQAMDEVKETEDYKSLCSQLAVRIKKIQRKLALDYAIRVNDLNCHALWQRFLASFCKLLPKAAKVFIAQHGINGYTKHQAVLDLVATLPNKALASIKMTMRKFLLLYKMTNMIAVMPAPTLQHNLQSVLNKITSPPPVGATAPPPPAEVTMPPTQVPTTTPATPTGPAATAAAAITPRGFVFTGQVNAARGVNVTPNVATGETTTNNHYTPAAATGFVTALTLYNSATHPGCTQANINHITNLQAGVTDDIAMNNEAAVSAAQIVGGQSTICQLLLFLIQQAITNLIEEFHQLQAVREEMYRIAGAILPTQLSDAAQRITAVVQAEQPIDRPVLCGIIRNEADKLLNKMRRCLQLLEAKVTETKGV
jgi:hypothetical protein